VELVLVGDGVLRRSLEEYAERLGITSSVRFLGFQRPDSLPALLHSADVFVMPSVWPETFSIANLEAMASSLPVVSFGCGAQAEYLVSARYDEVIDGEECSQEEQIDGKECSQEGTDEQIDDEADGLDLGNGDRVANSLLAQAPTAEALADCLERLFKDDRLRKRLGQNGARLVRMRYGQDDMIAAYEELYTRLHRQGQLQDVVRHQQYSENEKSDIENHQRRQLLDQAAASAQKAIQAAAEAIQLTAI
jgi:glycosyltransferase involved in cell wall biosynthesis